ncbi:MAG: argininosuccinate lyase, partial [Calditrichaeota bacterium]
MKLWQKNPKLIKEVEEFLSGEDILFDEKLIKYDCLASMAHVKMLHKINVLDSSEKQQLLEELQNIIEMHGQGLFKIKPGEEDCHTTIENHLTRKLGKVGKKIHTARSRNDQVLTALRLFYKDELQICKKQIMELINALKNFVAK